eukprot:6144510-Prymnesium_polylepis.1
MIGGAARMLRRVALLGRRVRECPTKSSTEPCVGGRFSAAIVPSFGPAIVCARNLERQLLRLERGTGLCRHLRRHRNTPRQTRTNALDAFGGSPWSSPTPRVRAERATCLTHAPTDLEPNLEAKTSQHVLFFDAWRRRCVVVAVGSTTTLT